jgi:hypothetical protein
MRFMGVSAAVLAFFIASSASAQQAEQPAAAPANAPAPAPAPAAAPAQPTEAEKNAATLKDFYGMQLTIAECGLTVAPRDAARFKTFVELMEIGSKMSPAELAQIKGKAMVDVKSNLQKECAEAKIGVLGLGKMLDEADKQLGGVLSQASVAAQGLQVPTSAPAAGGAALKGFAAIQALVGNTIAIKVDGKMQYDFLMPDGVVKNMEGSEISTGKWAAEGSKLCYRYEGYPKACYEVQAAGKDVTLTDADGQGWRYKLMDGNPKNL